MHRKMMVVSLIALFLQVSMGAFAADGDRFKGMIITRTGDTLIVSNANGKVTVLLNDGTQTKDDTGLFGLGTNNMSDTVLIPGLKVDIEGTSDGPGRIVAKTITVDGDDLETAEMIQSGLHPTAEQVLANERSIAANRQDIESLQLSAARNSQGLEASQRNMEGQQKQIQQNIKDIEETTDRFVALSDYDVKDQATVKFDVGQYEISAKDQEELQRLAQSALTRKGYIIEVLGFADSTGTAAMNQKLSEDRAKAVIAFLIQRCSVPVRHIVAPGAMGIYQPAASNETKEGRAENRRVEIKILINKGIASS
jgi:OOP family OmpA-OmpF porin